MTTWSESDLSDALEDSDASVSGGSKRDTSAPDADDTNRSASMQAVAKGGTPRGEMNDTECRWARLLDSISEVLWWEYELVRVRYGDGWHTPDMFVMLEDGSLVVTEVKAHCTDAGRTRFKAAAGQVPVLRWVMVVQKGKRQPWEVRYDTADKDGAPFL